MISFDGNSWQYSSNPSRLSRAKELIYGGPLGFVGVSNYDGQVKASTDGVSWTDLLTTNGTYSCVCWSEGQGYHAFAPPGPGSYVAWGSNASDWIENNNPFTPNNPSWTGCASSETHTIAVCDYGNGPDQGGVFYIDAQGPTFNGSENILTGPKFCSVTYGGGKFFCLGKSGISANYVFNDGRVESFFVATAV